MSRKLSQEEYVTGCIAAHKGFYTYKDLIYISGKHKVEITCPLHGNFWQLAESHKHSKQGCPVCARENTTMKQRKSQDTFLNEAEKANLGKYTFEDTVYVNHKAKVKVNCKKHGIFEIQAAHLLEGHGCKRCMAENSKLLQKDTTQDFIEKAVNKKGDEYTYENVDYQGSQIDVNITCKIHGSFWQNPSNHLQGAGCPKCGKSGYNRNIPGTFYILKDSDITKVGITNVATVKRLGQINTRSKRDFTIIFAQYFDKGVDALELETKVLRYLRGLYKSPEIAFEGSTECFFDVNLKELLNIVTQTESK